MVPVYLMWNHLVQKPPMRLWRHYGFMTYAILTLLQIQKPLAHPLELMMKGANHGGLWRVAYLARTALPFAAIYGFANDKLPMKKIYGLFKK